MALVLLELLLTPKDAVNHSVLQSLLRGHPVVSVSISEYLVDALTAMLGNDGAEFVARLADFLSGNENVGCLSSRTAKWLMNHHA